MKRAPKRQPAKRAAYHHGDLRQALLDAAGELLREHGAAGFSLREAARRIGVDPAACYRHFRDRGDLLAEIARQGFLVLAQRMADERARLAAASPAERLAALGHVYIAFAQEQPASFRVMFGESGFSARDPRLRPPTERSAYEQLEDGVRAWACARRITVDAAQVSLRLWAAVHGVARLIVDGALVLEQDMVRGLVDDLCRALLRDAERPAPRRR